MSPAQPSSVPWGAFTHDPRRPDAAGLRASDQDRDVVLEVLADGYADGRLAKDEYDDRADRTTATKVLGELPPIIADLVPATPTRTTGSDLSLASRDDLHRRAVSHWESQRSQALIGMLLPTIICWLVWAMPVIHEMGEPHHDLNLGFPWPVFVMLGTGAHLARVLMNRTQIIDEEQRRLAKKQRKALDRPRPLSPEQ